MDRVRFGRALGYGARHAAKALVQAADAATTPGAGPGSPVTRPAQGPAHKPVRATQAAKSTGSATQRTRQSFLHPIKRYSGTVLQQVVGTFFAVFALLMAQNAWRLRAGLHESLQNSDAQHFWLVAALFLLFGWFSVSSFLRARRLEHG